MAEVFELEPVDADNTGRWPEGMLGGAINNAGRADEGILARWYEDTDSSRTASGSSNAFAVTSSRTIAALFDSLTLVFTANHTITGAATLNLNGIGAKNIKRFNGNDLTAGDIVSGTPVSVIYKLAADCWFLVSAAAVLFANLHADFNENASPGNPAANVARLYAKDVSGATFLAYRDSAGLERVLVAEAETAGTLIAIIEDQKAQNTAGGTFTSGADQTRTLNTLVYNRDTLVSLASNRFTLPAGSWEIEWSAPAGNVNQHQTLLYNFTDTAEVGRGSSEFSESAQTISIGRARTTIASAKAFEIRHRCATTIATTGLGTAGNFSTEVYTRVAVRRA